MQTATNCYLFNLAIADMLTLLCGECDLELSFWKTFLVHQAAALRVVLDFRQVQTSPGVRIGSLCQGGHSCHELIRRFSDAHLFVFYKGCVLRCA